MRAGARKFVDSVQASLPAHPTAGPFASFEIQSALTSLDSTASLATDLLYPSPWSSLDWAASDLPTKPTSSMGAEAWSLWMSKGAGILDLPGAVTL